MNLVSSDEDIRLKVQNETFDTNSDVDQTRSFIQEQQPRVPQKAKAESNLSDKASALYNIFFALGSMAGPPLGGGLYDAVEWRETCIIMASISIVFSIVYRLVTFFCK